ncbi:hypothetical protein [Roseofilum sp. Guam]|uniref:hypothetical protein n=1 Tax=Roseofilum sp. Guam TaxID=2821502 RepID=UPI001B12A6E1|nr:hypothetical protein [Roseofilum sp. Guam]MBP0027990.1 hypothetical protein [Roseofilum sp. Guam]
MTSEESDLKLYDLIIIGSGNGACAFLSHYLAQSKNNNSQVLVLERGDSFFNTSDITHQINWTKSYAEGNIFKLHNALTPDGKPIISGWACTMGGGGSINYTMIHESSRWLAEHLGHNESYWDELKAELNAKFERPDPSINETPVTQHILDAGEVAGFQAPNPGHRIENIPSYQDYQSYSDRQAKQLYQFPTQFNPFGQRTHSGVSIVDWDDPRLELKTRCQMESLEFAPIDSPEADGSLAQCVAVQARFLDRDQTDLIRIPLTTGGKVILCAGAASPRLLMPYRQTLQNEAIGQQASRPATISSCPWEFICSTKTGKSPPRMSMGQSLLPQLGSPRRASREPRQSVALTFLRGILRSSGTLSLTFIWHFCCPIASSTSCCVPPGCLQSLKIPCGF